MSNENNFRAFLTFQHNIFQHLLQSSAYHGIEIASLHNIHIKSKEIKSLVVNYSEHAQRGVRGGVIKLTSFVFNNFFALINPFGLGWGIFELIVIPNTKNVFVFIKEIKCLIMVWL